MEKWKVLHDADDDEGNPTMWSIKADEKVFYWIEQTDVDSYDVIDTDAKKVLKTCKSLTSAKRWVATNVIQNKLWKRYDD